MDDLPSARCAGDRVFAPTPLCPALDNGCGVEAVDAGPKSATPGEVGEFGISTGSLGPGGFARAVEVLGVHADVDPCS